MHRHRKTPDRQTWRAREMRRGRLGQDLSVPISIGGLGGQKQEAALSCSEGGTGVIHPLTCGLGRYGF